MASKTVSLVQLYSISWNSSIRGIRMMSERAIARDGRAIVCLHPRQEVDVELTKPLSPKHKGVGVGSRTITNNEEMLIRKLREEDPFVWSMGTLAKLFMTEPSVIGQIAPLPVKRKAFLMEEKRKMSQMRPHQRKIYISKQEEEKHRQLEAALADRKHLFPFYQHSLDTSS